MGEIAIINSDLANALIKCGYTLYQFKRGVYTDVYYFDETEGILEAIDRLIINNFKEI